MKEWGNAGGFSKRSHVEGRRDARAARTGWFRVGSIVIMNTNLAKNSLKVGEELLRNGSTEVCNMCEGSW